eukprot:365556-Chlamydomonas_euryale.AAC.1
MHAAGPRLPPLHARRSPMPAAPRRLAHAGALQGAARLQALPGHAPHHQAARAVHAVRLPAAARRICRQRRAVHARARGAGLCAAVVARAGLADGDKQGQPAGHTCVPQPRHHPRGVVQPRAVPRVAAHDAASVGRVAPSHVFVPGLLQQRARALGHACAQHDCVFAAVRPGRGLAAAELARGSVLQGPHGAHGRTGWGAGVG